MWDTPIKGPLDRRSLELASVTYEQNTIVISVSEDLTGEHWSLRFTNTQGLKITTFESAFDITKNISSDCALFEFKKSKWLISLGQGELEYMENSRHFVICCYDEIIEVAAWEVNFTQIN